MLAQNNVVDLYKNELYDEIQAFLNGEIQNENTRESYNANIRQFFKTILNKEIEHLTIEDVKKIKKKDVLNYRKYLQDNFDLANSTINNKISAPKSLYVYLSSEYDVNTNIFNFKGLKVHHESYGSLSQTEAERFAETAFLTEREKNQCKKLLILLAIRTSFRLNELLNLQWKDFEYSNGVYKVTTYHGKGDKHNTTAITEKFYNELCKLKEENKLYRWNGNPEIVFQVSEQAINDMMSRLREKLEIPASRRIVFHSFRGVAIDFVLESTNGDITKAAIHANHSNPATTFKHYVNKTKDYTQSAGVLMEEEMDLSFLDGVSLDEFKAFFKQNSRQVQIELKKFIEK